MAAAHRTEARALASLVALLALAASGCASTARGVPFESVQVVNKAVLPQGTFVLVHRIYVENWHVQMFMPWYDTYEQAIDGLRDEAAQRGANAVTNVSCIPVTAWTRAPKVFCHGDAVKLTPEGARRAAQAAAI
jgi:hypothetical protein